jgi:PhnB protein
MHIEPYLFFEGRCDEAIEFYRKSLGATVNQILRYKDSPEPNSGMMPPNSADKIMHASFQLGASRINCSDGGCSGKPTFEGISLVIEAKDDAEAERAFHALADGGAVRQPLIETFFSSRFGMLADKFGVNWMVMTTRADA